MYDWEKPLNVLMKKVFNYDSLHSNVDDICIAITAIVDLCQDRDNHRYDVFKHFDNFFIIQIERKKQLVCMLRFPFIIFALVLSDYV